MKREDFVRAYAKRSNFSDKMAHWGYVNAGNDWILIALPCACGDESCEGWAMLSAEWVLHHLQFNAPDGLREAYMKSVEDEEAKT
jgi:hypothetical protein